MSPTSIGWFSKCSTHTKASSFYTTPIYYVNAAPHIGHLYSSVIADAAQRWQKVFKKDSIIKFSTGTDEHGSKIQQAAVKHKTAPVDYCSIVSSQFRSLSDEFSVNYTNFVRTTDEKHIKTVEKLWGQLIKLDTIYSSTYEGWYCIPDETFLTDFQLKELMGNNGQKVMVSTESGHPVEWTREENYIFKLSSFKDDVKHWLNSSESVVRPKKFHKVLLDRLDLLEDLSVSRPTSRVHWGIPVPDDPSQTVYVWLDALANYLTAAKYADNDDKEFRKAWPPDLQVIGKDILKFHGIYWPSFLIAIGLEPPKSIFCHSHWLVDDEKMSKSKGNVVCPFERAKVYTTDGLRYFLLREGVAHSDGNYSDSKVIRILNSELADTLGNLLSRCTGTVLNPNQTFPKIEEQELIKISSLDVTKKLLDKVESLPDTCRTHYEDLNFYKVADAVIATIHAANLFFETMKPWELKKRPDAQGELNCVLHLSLETLRVASTLLQPLIPNLSRVLLDKLNVRESDRYFSNAKNLSWKNLEFLEKRLTPDKIVLFKRIILEGDTKSKRKSS